MPIIEPVTKLPSDDVLTLYGAVGWTAYTADPTILTRALDNSSFVVAAREDGRLIGLARALSDDATICYLQDVLVHPDHQRGGIGRKLVAAILQRYVHVRQKVLLTDDEPAQRAFYESLGYTEIRDVEAAALRAFVRFDTQTG